MCGRSSSGRAPPCQGGGSEFEPRRPLHMWKFSSAGRASALQAEGQRFEPVNFHHMARKLSWLEHQPVTLGVVGSSPIRVVFASVAQSVEQGTENPRVIGSIPIGGTTSKILSFIGKSCRQDFCDEYQIFSFSPQNLAPQAFAGAPKFARIAREGAGINAPDMRP